MLVESGNLIEVDESSFVIVVSFIVKICLEENIGLRIG